MITISVSIDERLLARVDKLAEGTGQSRSQIIRECVSDSFTPSPILEIDRKVDVLLRTTNNLANNLVDVKIGVNMLIGKKGI